ncbi:RHS repeat-associated core domain-containing protein [Streptomyces europaeiscabiei]|uniref:RHS repeat-associated core domain-containing protein n=1 Tax=Streptomyces europaeiscabiei TaxID=146819 RepID=UPI0038B5151E
MLQLANLHGDIALQLPADTAVAPTVLDADEFGNARPGQQATRCNWLGAHQCSSETVTGLSLVGARLYDPATGRFLSADPVQGGSANACDSPNADPVNQFDLDGRSAKKKRVEARACWSLGYSGCVFASYLSGIPLWNIGTSKSRNNAVRHCIWQAALTFFLRCGCRQAAGRRPRVRRPQPRVPQGPVQTTGRHAPSSAAAGTAGRWSTTTATAALHTVGNWLYNRGFLAR